VAYGDFLAAFNESWCYLATHMVLYGDFSAAFKELQCYLATHAVLYGDFVAAFKESWCYLATCMVPYVISWQPSTHHGAIWPLLWWSMVIAW
jgi:hypothetical protein